MTHSNVCLLLSKGHCYRSKRIGKRKHNFVQGYTVDANWSILNLIIVKKRRGREGRGGKRKGREGRGGKKKSGSEKLKFPKRCNISN